MDITLPINSQTLTALTKIKDHPLAQKLGQSFEAAVIRIDNKQTGITLKINDQYIEVQSSQPVPLDKGQTITVLVTRLLPALEFKIVSEPSHIKNTPVILTEQAAAPSTKFDAPPPEKSAFNRLAPPSNELIQAKVVSVSPDKIHLSLSTGRSTAETLEQTVVLPADKNRAQNLKPGQHVIVEVVRHEKSREIKITPAMPQEIQTIIRDHLPKHETSTVLLNQLITDLPSLQVNTSVSETLKQLAQEILQKLRTPDQLANGKQLKTAVEGSGLFLEARLLETDKQQSERLQSDFKGLLLKLIAYLKIETASQPEKPVNVADTEQLKNLMQKTENSIAKLTLNQLASLPNDDSPKQVWLLEIPFLGESKAQSVEIEIERDRKSGSEQDEQGTWSVYLTITPPTLGTLHCKLSYLDGKINAHFWSERRDVTDLIKQNLAHLKKQFEAEGLSPGFIDAMEGTPTRQKTAPLITVGLINEKA